MQKELYQPSYLMQAEDYHKKSVHASWSGKKAESQKFGRLCGDFLIKSLGEDDLEPEYKVSIYWRAVLQHDEVRRQKIAIQLAEDALDFIKLNNLEQHRLMFESYLIQNSSS